MADPKLKAAMEQIKAVLREHDIAGVVVLSSQTSLEFLVQLDTTWTALRPEGPDGLRLRCKAVDYPDAKTQKKVLTDTIGTLAGTLDVLDHLKEGLGGLLERAGAVVGFSHMTHADRASYFISPDGKSITCNLCTKTSWNIEDVRRLYCGHCKIFHQFT